MKPHIHADLIKQWADGAEIQYRDLKWSNRWHDDSRPDWMEWLEYRIKPTHPHQALIDAFNAGAKIQYFHNQWGTWVDLDRPEWYETEKYRVKPQHPDQAVFDAWKKGATIQTNRDNYPMWYGVKGWHTLKDFKDAIGHEIEEHVRYRVKPQDIVIEHEYKYEDNCGLYNGYNKPNVRFTFDIDTKKLKAVELI